MLLIILASSESVATNKTKIFFRKLGKDKDGIENALCKYFGHK